MLSELDNQEYKVHLLQTSSGMAEVFVEDKLKGLTKANLSTTFNVQNNDDVKVVADTIQLDPITGGKWFIIVDRDKSTRIGKELITLMNTNDLNCTFLVKSKNYKSFKDISSKVNNVNKLYLERINMYDVDYLFSDSVPYGIKRRIAKGYGNSVEKVFKIFQEILQGTKITNNKQLVEIAGVPEGSLSSFIMSLLGTEIKSAKGKNIIFKRRAQVLAELLVNYGCFVVQYRCKKILKDLYDIKVLSMKGIIYKTIRNNIPEQYDFKELSRYSRFLNKIISIPITDIIDLQLRITKGGNWKDNMDAFNFLYDILNSRAKGNILV